jgi:16S rRNA (guanine1516-N2)-methyltransferase
MPQVPLVAPGSQMKRANQLSRRWGFEIRQPKEQDCYFLEIYEERLQLRKYGEPKLGAIFVNFNSGVSKYRRQYGGGRKQAIAKAVGLKNGAMPLVVDATAGLGRDAFVLTSLGCCVHMIERVPIVAALLEDGLARARNDPEIGVWVSERMSLSVKDSRYALSELPFKPEVVYLDPMYPEKRKSALVKKEMRVFQSLVGQDSDADDLWEAALKIAQERVVVKRPAHADWLAGQKPHTSIKTKKHRFDIYLVDPRAY